MLKAVLYGRYPACEISRLRKLLRTPWELDAISETTPGAEKILTFSDAHALITSSYKATDPVAPKLRLLQCASTGMENIELRHLPPGCIVCNAYGHEIAIAEYVIWALLDWSVGSRRIQPFMATGRWSVGEWISVPNHSEADGRTLGIIGFGRIGREVARRASALGMKIIALSRWRGAAPDSELLDQAFKPTEAAEFLKRADFIVVSCPISSGTIGMVNREWFSHMRSSAILVQVGRGPVIDEGALFEALERRRIRGATLDVWYQYPNPNEEKVAFARLPFHELPNVVITPHIAARSEEAWDRRFCQIAKNLDALSFGLSLQNVIHVVPHLNQRRFEAAALVC